MAEYDYDIVVIGSGPAGQGAALQAAELDKRVLMIEKYPEIGGVNVSSGGVSKTLREAVMHLTGYRERAIYGESYSVKQNITLSDLMVRNQYVSQQHIHILRSQLIRNRIELVTAEGSFVDRHTINLASDGGKTNRTITADKIIIGVGTDATHPPVVHADGRLILVGYQVMDMSDLPRTLVVVGAGAVGLEYCGTFAALGVRVTLVDRKNRLLPFMDEEVTDVLAHHLRQNGVTLRLNEAVFDIEYYMDERGNRVRVLLQSNKQILTDAVLYCVGRTGATASLNLTAAGLEADDRGRLDVDDNYQTAVEGIYAAGGVIGFPDLASTSRMQGRAAARHMFGIAADGYQDLMPYMIKTIPEIAVVGKTEAELTDAGIPYEVGMADYRENVNSIVKGVDAGFLKLLFNNDTRELLGVHIVGEGAAEMVHIGQAVMAYGGKIDYFLDAVISHPTMAESYVTAALDGINRLGL